MSMSDLFTKEQDEAASTEGWQLCHVFDSKTQRIGVRILAVDARLRNAELATRFVIDRASAKSHLHILALQKIAASHVASTKAKKGKKK